MITIDNLSPRALHIVVTGHIGGEELGRLLDSVLTTADTSGEVDILVEVTAPFDVEWLTALGAELKRMTQLPRLLAALNRVAVVSTSDWLKAGAKVEGALIPGAAYKTFEPREAAEARAWLLGEKD